MTRDSCPFSTPVQELKGHKIKLAGSGFTLNTRKHFSIVPALQNSFPQDVLGWLEKECAKRTGTQYFVRTLFDHPTICGWKGRSGNIEGRLRGVAFTTEEVTEDPWQSTYSRISRKNSTSEETNLMQKQNDPGGFLEATGLREKTNAEPEGLLARLKMAVVGEAGQRVPGASPACEGRWKGTCASPVMPGDTCA